MMTKFTVYDGEVMRVCDFVEQSDSIRITLLREGRSSAVISMRVDKDLFHAEMRKFLGLVEYVETLEVIE